MVELPICSKPLVSVIMIFLNAEKFIQEAIDSVFVQTYDNWELLLIDDGSTDASTAIALRHAEQYPGKAFYFDHDGHQNRGMSASRNLGIRNARGEYIAFLDADDVYLPQKLERQVAILASQPTAAMVYGATQHWYSWTGKTEDLHRDMMRKLGVPPNTLIQSPRMLPRFLRREAWTPGTCGVLIRREAIEQIGGFDENFRGMFEDQVFFYKLCLNFSVFVASGCWDRYRQHSDSCCGVMLRTGEWISRRPNSAQRNFFNWLENYLTKQGVTDIELWKALRKELWPYRHPVIYQLLPNIDWVKQIKKRLQRGATS